MHRPTVGLIALVLLAGAVTCYFFNWGSAALESAFWRVGLVLALLWLALPDLSRVRSKSVWALLLGTILVIVVRPKLAPLMIVFCVVYVVLRPRRPATHRREEKMPIRPKRSAEREGRR